MNSIRRNISTLTAGLIVVLALFASASVASAALNIVTTVAVSPGPFGVGLNSTTNRIYVTHSSTNSVSVIDGATNAVIATISVGSDPDRGVAINEALNRIYVVNRSSSTLSVIDGATNTVIATVSLGSNPLNAVFNSTTGNVYVTNQFSGSVTVISTASNTVVATISGFNSPVPIASSQTSDKVYVGGGNCCSAGGGILYVIDGSSNSIVATLTGLGPGPEGLAVNDGTNRIYFAGANAGAVSVIDSLSNTEIALVAVANPRGLAVDTLTNRIYAVSGSGAQLVVIDGASNTVVDSIGVGANPHFVAFNEQTGRAYVTNTNSSSVSVIEEVTADTTPPTLSLPADIDVEATSAAGADVEFTVTATDDTDPSPVVTCTPASGSTFPVGTTVVNCTATDASDNSSDGSFSVTVTLAQINVLIDIKPGSDPNCFNNNGNGVIPVAILGSADLDVTEIDAATVSLEGMSVKAVGKSNKLLASFDDVNDDGFTDLVVKIEDEDGIFEAGNGTATLTGNLLAEFGSTPIEGSDSICVTQ